MGKVTKTVQNGKSVLTYSIKKKELINQHALDVIFSERIPEIMMLREKKTFWGGKKLICNVNYPDTLAHFFLGEIQYIEFVNAMRKIGLIIRACEQNDMPPDGLDFDPSHIYCNQEDNDVHMIYWPVRERAGLMSSQEGLLKIGSDYCRMHEDKHKRQMEKFISYLKSVPFHSDDFLAFLGALEIIHIKESTTAQMPEDLTNVCLFMRREHCFSPIDLEENILGRDPLNCTVEIRNNTSVSRVHAAIYKDVWENCMIQDRDSVNGTYINGERLEPHKAMDLRNGDQIFLGNEEIIFCQPIKSEL